MTAMQVRVLGGPERLERVTVPVPVPDIGEVLVRVRAAGINPADVGDQRTGVFSGPPPFTPGWDVSGEVAALGPGVTVHRVGDPVLGLLPFPRRAGAYAEYAVGPARAFVPKPDTIDHVQAAALPLAGLTALQALVDTADVQPGARVAVTAASGGVGHLAVQVVAELGAHAVAVTSARSVDLLRDLGVREFVDRDRTTLVDGADPVDVVFELVGGDAPLASLRALVPGGVLVSSLPQSLGPVRPLAAELGVTATGLFVESDGAGLAHLVELVHHGAVRPVVAAVHDLADAARAQSEAHGPGKVVLQVP
ncbi:NADPH:quinone reductase-like Zn-dependent oxidoreductase [Curtobacterium sp. JUb34]|nr:MAG: NADPH:quinone reductase [Leifsonia xyli]ROR35921.1 NADPH:quinone reductase-like Zn-dependent oxidoreductase [Curtobacterium sp. JUb34]